MATVETYTVTPSRHESELSPTEPYSFETYAFEADSSDSDDEYSDSCSNSDDEDADLPPFAHVSSHGRPRRGSNIVPESRGRSSGSRGRSSSSPTRSSAYPGNLSTHYMLAHSARTKLQKEANKSWSLLRLVVGHANLLDSLIQDIDIAEKTQTEWVKSQQSFRSSSRPNNYYRSDNSQDVMSFVQGLPASFENQTPEMIPADIRVSTPQHHRSFPIVDQSVVSVVECDDDSDGDSEEIDPESFDSESEDDEISTGSGSIEIQYFDSLMRPQSVPSTVSAETSPTLLSNPFTSPPLSATSERSFTPEMFQVPINLEPEFHDEDAEDADLALCRVKTLRPDPVETYNPSDNKELYPLSRYSTTSSAPELFEGESSDADSEESIEDFMDTRLSNIQSESLVHTRSRSQQSLFSLEDISVPYEKADVSTPFGSPQSSLSPISAVDPLSPSRWLL